MTTPQNAAFTADPDDPMPELDRVVDGTDDDRDAEDADRSEADRRATPPGDPSPDDQLGPGEPAEPVGNDNIREGRVGGVMGGPRQQGGQGQGG